MVKRPQQCPKAATHVDRNGSEVKIFLIGGKGRSFIFGAARLDFSHSLSS